MLTGKSKVGAWRRGAKRECFPIHGGDAHAKKWIRYGTAPFALASREADDRIAWTFLEQETTR